MTPAESYMHAKLCTILHGMELHRRFRPLGLSARAVQFQRARARSVAILCIIRAAPPTPHFDCQRAPCEFPAGARGRPWRGGQPSEQGLARAPQSALSRWLWRLRAPSEPGGGCGATPIGLPLIMGSSGRHVPISIHGGSISGAGVRPRRCPRPCRGVGLVSLRAPRSPAASVATCVSAHAGSIFAPQTAVVCAVRFREELHGA